jgi:hypothetical protein
MEKDITPTQARQQFFKIVKNVRSHNFIYTVRDQYGFAQAIICKPDNKRLHDARHSELQLRKLTRKLFDFLGKYLDGEPYIIVEKPKPQYDDFD